MRSFGPKFKGKQTCYNVVTKTSRPPQPRLFHMSHGENLLCGPIACCRVSHKERKVVSILCGHTTKSDGPKRPCTDTGPASQRKCEIRACASCFWTCKMVVALSNSLEPNFSRGRPLKMYAHMSAAQAQQEAACKRRGQWEEAHRLIPRPLHRGNGKAKLKATLANQTGLPKTRLSAYKHLRDTFWQLLGPGRMWHARVLGCCIVLPSDFGLHMTRMRA